ncbi:non-ribosomal peptide synthetase [Planktothrix agardhii]|uniref:non-ribosomal peptide synthetase n=2 Tax=Planktothrix agardhii TaxID=1160 RepID=UPI001D09B8C6|nr:non-ribosomal peptide synthetase [Planktothrix agardhii]MCB8783758.1 amino acid adenylation domain-containing protein [Planktothrix agardhii 1808]MCF3565218.1 amino acid adenylation domain-containing protein [Planktothrix agardhii 1807]MCF3597174.1 amino acid adenylation domain-containing protein [Planktothrix agardhii 1032]MCF3622139.1 amino acid adenylation domain-containing protein [Planktothrix agardhii 1030]
MPTMPDLANQKIAITATFTSEPVEDSLSYWLKAMGFPDSIEFAQYNQIFQELLNPSSLLATNQNGVNVVLVRFEDWQGTKNRLQLTVDDSLKTQLFGQRLRYRLPNHIEIAHLNQYETEYLYQEIFVDRVYLRHGIVLNEDDCIIDVGANIGLFTLFAQQKSPKGTIYAFEPAPHAFDKLQINAKLYCPNTHLFNCGLGGERREETFTFYPRSSVFSSFAADAEQDEKAIRSVIINMLQRDHSLDEESLEKLADEFIKDRLKEETYQVQLRTLSEIIEEYKIKKIDLLKLDAEKSELAILQGINNHHWSLIKQIVMEVHDQEGSTLKQVLRLLEDKGFRFVVDEESMLHGSGLFNIYATRLNLNHNPLSQEWGQNLAQIEQTVKDFTNALKTAITRSPNPYLVCICPPSPTDEKAFNGLHEKLQEQLETELQQNPSICLIKSQELLRTYPVQEYYDPYGDELGHIPYNLTFFTALGTILARKILALKSSPYKVIALDCDNTLWNGICGEDGVKGVKIDAPFRALQEFIIAQQATGKLICLCSKNQADDVFAVFEQHPDMLLQRNHLVNWRINWQEKSQNLQSLAEELQLGLDSFIFIDDNPIECAKVRANCPEVLTLQLPQESEKIPQFLDHIWAFDQLQTTQEDQQRTNLYQQNIQRQRLQENSLSFEDFLAQLNLEIEISPVQKEELTRVAQLTQRTNQFNLTTIRRSESQIKQLCNSGELDCRGVKVKDRFGDYGLVGLLLFTAQEDSLIVDTFLLSCRVLGRGVEHQMLAYLGTVAQEKRLAKVELFYKSTPKNKPICDFLTGIEKGLLQEKKDGVLFEFSAQIASETIFSPRSNVDSLNQKTKINLEEITAKSDSLSYRILNYQFFENIAQNLYNPELILQEIAGQQQRQRQLDGEFVAPRTPLEKAIASLFIEVLKLDRVGIDDDFFELGGDSIRGAILINKLQAQLSEIIHFVILFDQKTVRRLAAYLEEHYPKAIAKILGKAITEINDLSQERIDEAKVLQMRSLIPALTSTVDDERDDNSKNPPAIFILSPYRSGSTLLRVILGGNPQLFAPPELELLGFNTLGERKAQFSGRYNFWMEGTIRTIMEIKGCNAEEAIAIMEELEDKNLTSQQFYRLLQEWLGDKILIDKTPSYSLDLETLKRAEINFHNPLYIHLVRHPLGMIHSYEEAKIDQIFPYQNPFNSRELAELVWLISHQNILEFLQQVSPQRQYQVKFEDIVKQPQKTIESLCQFLGVEFNSDMLQPYKEKKQRMTDGIYAESRMIGDVKFHKHQSINPNTVDQWKDYYNTDFLGNVTWQLAESFKYPSNNHNITQVSRENPTESQTFPVSFAQQRLWILAQLEPDSPFYNMFKAVHLQGRINLEILERSLNEIIDRHEILRTNFQEVEATPVQVIAPHATLKISVIDLQGLSEQEQSEQLQLFATEDQLQPFDLTTGILLRVTFVQLKSESSALLLTMHHIISDGWSMGVLIKELSSLYQGFLLGHASVLPKLPIQYADFTLWQRQWLQGENQGFITIQNQINYWKQQLAAAPPLLELPTDRPRPSVQTFRGGCLSFQIDERLTASLKELSHKSATTLFMTLMAAYVTLLFRHSDQNDILIGTPIASRNYQELEGLIGFFVNTLVMRTRLEGNPSFEELLKQVRSVCRNAYANQDVPFEQIIETLQIERSLSHSPLFQVMFVLQNVAMEELETPGLKISPLSLDNVNAKFDFALQMWEINTEKGNSLQGFWQYNIDLFDQDRIARMSGHFQTLLEAIVANPQEPIGTLSLLTERERHQLLVEWNDTDTAYPDKKCIHQLFEEQVERTPDAVAVVFENESLTYGELNNRANQLAHYLCQNYQIKPDTLVGICVERSLEMIIGILGILKAGAAYLPLDPEYPQERLSFMLEDSQVKVLVTQAKLVESIPEHQAQLVCLDTDWEKIAQNITSNPENKSEPENLTYIIYTSGSTGKPKGVLVNHANVVRLFAATDSWYHFNCQDVWTLFHSYAFDFSVWEIWGALLYGGRLVIVPYLVTRSPESFYELLCQEKVTILNQTPTAFRQLIQAEASLKRDISPLLRGVGKDSATDNDLSLRLVIFGGESLEINSLQPWFDRHGDQFPQLVNMYGITETTVHVTYRPLSMADVNSTASVIGRPLPDLQVYLLDQYLQPVPVGVLGEMYVGGAGVTRGYLNRPELTTERFIPNPFDLPLLPINRGGTQAGATLNKLGTQGGAKLYKTGDLARYLPNGELEYLGRIDNQVKIRGFRIELGEIEALLASHPQIWETVVLVWDDKTGDKRLVAYIVPQPEITITIDEIRQFLKAKLPDYMVPNAFVILAALPLTANGKIDRRALPPPESGSEVSDKYVAPRTPMEEILATIWSEVLKVEKVGINDNFFELGGHSLLATQLVAQIRDRLKIELPLRQLFNTATLAELAQGIEQLKQQTSTPIVTAILPRRRK